MTGMPSLCSDRIQRYVRRKCTSLASANDKKIIRIQERTAFVGVDARGRVSWWLALEVWAGAEQSKENKATSASLDPICKECIFAWLCLGVEPVKYGTGIHSTWTWRGSSMTTSRHVVVVILSEEIRTQEVPGRLYCDTFSAPARLRPPMWHDHHDDRRRPSTVEPAGFILFAATQEFLLFKKIR